MTAKLNGKALKQLEAATAVDDDLGIALPSTLGIATGEVVKSEVPSLEPLQKLFQLCKPA